MKVYAAFKSGQWHASALLHGGALELGTIVIVKCIDVVANAGERNERLSVEEKRRDIDPGTISRVCSMQISLLVPCMYFSIGVQNHRMHYSKCEQWAYW